MAQTGLVRTGGALRRHYFSPRKWRTSLGYLFYLPSVDNDLWKPLSSTINRDTGAQNITTCLKVTNFQTSRLHDLYVSVYSVTRTFACVCLS